MRALILAITALTLGFPALAQDQVASIENQSIQVEAVTVKANGMVCDFCAQAVIKVFGREDAVESVTVDMNAGEILIDMKPGQTLDDARITELVKKSGYAIVSIDRALT